MNRRSFLALLGAAPVAASVPAVASAKQAPLEGEIIPPFRFDRALGQLEIGKITAGVLKDRDVDPTMVIDLGAGNITVRT